MPDPSNSSSSFIPKRGAVARKKHTATSRQVYIFAIFSYVLIFAVMLASGGMFLYTKYLDRMLQSSITELYQEIDAFQEEKIPEVVAFDKRLEATTARFNSTASLVTIFEALEAATIDTVAYDKIELTREGDDHYLLAGSVLTDSFDSVLFQRTILNKGGVISGVSVQNINVAGLADGVTATDATEVVADSGAVTLADVTFEAELVVPISAIPYQAEYDAINSQLPVQGDTSIEQFGTEPVVGDNQEITL